MRYLRHNGNQALRQHEVVRQQGNEVARSSKAMKQHSTTRQHEAYSYR
jgi:hypothetical protein